MLPTAVVRGRQNPLHVAFAERLRRARKAAGLSHAEISRQAGLASRTTTTILESGASRPRVDTVEKLARALNLSPGFLAFGLAQPSAPSDVPLSMGLPERLLQARQLRALSRLQLGQRSETSHTLVRMTETGTTLPTLAKLEALAKALNVSPAWLAYGIEPMETAPTSRSSLSLTEDGR